MKWFWLIWSFDACCALIALWFFGSGIRTATNPGDYLASWLPVLGFVVAILAGSIWLRGKDCLLWAKLCLFAGALPGLLWGGLFVVMMLFGNNKWN